MTSVLHWSRWTASLSLVSLIILGLGWEIFWAPLRPGGNLLFLKVLPLLAPLFGILRGRRYTYQWSAMLILLYFSEGVVRAWAEHGLSHTLALLEVLFSVLFFAAALCYARLSRPA